MLQPYARGGAAGSLATAALAWAWRLGTSPVLSPPFVASQVFEEAVCPEVPPACTACLEELVGHPVFLLALHLGLALLQATAALAACWTRRARRAAAGQHPRALAYRRHDGA